MINTQRVRRHLDTLLLQHTSFTLVALSFLALTLLSGVFAQATPGGVTITNQATVTFTDSDGTERETVSNIVTIFVQTVYDFAITPDDGRDPSGGSATSNDFAGYDETDGSNDLTGAVGDTLTFEYTLTNNTNNAIDVLLEVLQDTTDDFNLNTVAVTVTDPDGTPLTPVAGVYALAQGTAYTVTVTGVIPAGTQGNEVALIDLVAANQGAPGEPAPTVGPNTSYENNNVGRTTVSEAPAIGIANAATTLNNGDGSYLVTYTLNVENFSNTPLDNIQVTDDLALTFGGATSFSVQSVTSGDFDVNPAYSGTGAPGSATQNLLGAGNTLAAGASGTITVTVLVTPGANLGPYTNQANASGTTPLGVLTTDLSSNGPDPDAGGDIPANDNDGDPTNTDSPTPVIFAEVPSLGVAKAASAVTTAAGGTFNVTYTVTLENAGDVVLNGVQVTDVLSDTFPAPATFTLVGAPTTTGGLVANTAFDGTTDTNLLAASSTLAAGTTQTVTFTVNFDPNGLPGPFNNSASGTGTSPTGSLFSDASQNGDDPDPDGNGDPTNNNEVTPINLTETPFLGVAKDLTSITDAGSGSFAAAFTVTVENLGNVNLNAVQVTDTLSATFPDPATFEVTTVPTSTDLSVNPGFDGDTDTDLLLGTDVLEPGNTATLSFVVTFDPNGAATFANTANGSATSPLGITVNDASQDGTDPDPDGNNNPADNSVPTPIVVPETAELGLAKQLGTVVNNGDGTYTVPYTLTVENTGNVDVSSLQVTDDLGSTFPTPVAFTVVGDPTATGGLTPNAGFDGDADTALLAGTDTFEVGASATIIFTVTVTPGSTLGPFDNQANATALTPGGGTSTDASTDGLIPDADGDGDPTNDSAVTPVTFEELPVLGVGKDFTTPTPAAGFPGQFETSITVTLENLGNVVINGVQATDDLAAVFPGPATFTVVGDPTATGGLTPNAGFDGDADTTLLSGSNTLAAGATGTVTFTVRFDPNGLTGPFDNTAVGTGTSPAGAPLSDNSQNGTDPDPDGDGDPLNNDEPTPIAFDETPVLGVAKSFTPSESAVGFPGEFETTITVTLENLGNVVISAVQATDLLSSTFPAPATFTVVGAPTTTGGLTPNATFNGTTDSDLLGGTDTLAAGATGTVSFTVRFDPNGLTGPFNNTAVGTGTSPAGTPLTDDSQNGDDPDPDGDGDPLDNDEPTPITFTEGPVVGVAKSASVTSFPEGDDQGPFTVELSFVIENLGDVNLTALSLTDDLDVSLGAGNYTVVAAPAVTGGPSTVTANPAFDGSSDTQLLGPGSSLDLGEAATLSFSVEIATPGSYTNLASVAGTGPGGTTATDTSDDGTDPDPDGDGNPDEAGENDPTVINLDALAAVKSARICADADCTTIVDPDADGGEVEPGQYIEYTIAATNAGEATIDNVTITDPVPLNTQFAFSTQTSAGIQCATGGGFAPCPTGTSGGSAPTVTEVQLPVGSLPAGETATLVFVVLVP